MISEREFAQYYSDFWRNNLPNLEPLVRSINLRSTTIWSEIDSPSDPNRRDIISETAYNLAASSWESGSDTSEGRLIAESAAQQKISLFKREKIAHSLQPLTSGEWKEVEIASKRILGFCREAKPSAVLFRPQFKGHGIIGPCEGDILIGNQLVEIKYVSRNFKSVDLKQALVYALLEVLSGKPAFTVVTLLNPFKGVSSREAVDDVIAAAGGLCLLDVANRFSDCIASGDLSR